MTDDIDADLAGIGKEMDKVIWIHYSYLRFR